MAINPIRKGEFCVVQVTHSATYAFGSGRGTESYDRWCLARVESASRAGEVRRVQFAGSAHSVELAHMRATVHAMPDDYKARAAALWAETTRSTEYVDKAALGIALRLAGDRAAASQ